ncbi:MAG: hypothetical protein ABI220_04790 [Candidatus Saccharimonadales bacterium]
MSALAGICGHLPGIFQVNHASAQHNIIKRYSIRKLLAPYKDSNKRFWILLGGVILLLAALGVIFFFSEPSGFGGPNDEVITTIERGNAIFELHAQVSWDNFCSPLNYVTITSSEETNKVVLVHGDNGGPCPSRVDNSWLKVDDYNHDGKADFKVRSGLPFGYDVYLYTPSSRTFELQK